MGIRYFIVLGKKFVKVKMIMKFRVKVFSRKSIMFVIRMNDSGRLGSRIIFRSDRCISLWRRMMFMV